MGCGAGMIAELSCGQLSFSMQSGYYSQFAGKLQQGSDGFESSRPFFLNDRIGRRSRCGGNADDLSTRVKGGRRRGVYQQSTLEADAR